MSMKSSLLSEEEETDHQDMTTIQLEDNEKSPLQPNRMSPEERTLFHDLQTEVVKTRKGDIHVAVQGDRTKKHTAIVTLHDIGQNHISCFQSYFCFHQFKPLLNNFTVYHINFPGQQEYADELPEDYIFPTMDEMADVLDEIFHYFSLKNTICFGVGAGANVLSRLSLLNAKYIDCLVSVNGTCTTSSWSEWGYEKMASHYLKTKGMTAFTEDYLMYHFFGKVDETSNHDLIGLFKDQLRRVNHPRNLALFVESYSKRTALKIERPIAGKNNTTTIPCPVLLLTGENSPSLDDTVTFNSKLDPSKSTWIKIPDATSMVLEEQPTPVTSAVVLFLQGYGYVMKARPPTLSFVANEEVEGPPAIC